MLNGMMSPDIGDDGLGEDPTVIQLETMIAAQAGVEVVVFYSLQELSLI
jgi:threonine aldolase